MNDFANGTGVFYVDVVNDGTPVTEQSIMDVYDAVKCGSLAVLRMGNPGDNGYCAFYYLTEISVSESGSYATFISAYVDGDGVDHSYVNMEQTEDGTILTLG